MAFLFCKTSRGFRNRLLLTELLGLTSDKPKGNKATGNGIDKKISSTIYSLFPFLYGFGNISSSSLIAGMAGPLILRLFHSKLSEMCPMRAPMTHTHDWEQVQPEKVSQVTSKPSCLQSNFEVIM